MSNKSNKKRYKKPIKFQTLAIIVGLTVSIMVSAYSAYKSSAPSMSDIEYSQFISLLDAGDIKSAEIVKTRDTIKLTTVNGDTFNIVNPDYDEFKKELLEAGVSIEARKSSGDEAILGVLSTMPLLILTFLIVWFLVRTVGGQSKTLFNILKPEDIVTFDDVAGMSETKEEIKFAVSQLKNREKLAKLGARPCKGIILEGPPGTGKTLLAKAIAGEAGVPFISTSGADFVEMFVGLGAARVRSLWDLAMTNAPCVIFIDEIDAVGRRRSGGGDGASIEGNQTLNALLQKMDGLGVGTGIFVVAATNRITDLDPALLRPGRFDKHLYIGPPKSKRDRDEIIKVHMKRKSFSENLDFNSASKLMFGLSGAEIEQVLNEAVLISIYNNREGVVELSDIDEASMKLRASGVSIQHTCESDKVISAVHEAGHTIIGLTLGRKISKVSILPYSSGIGGLTMEDTDNKEDKKLRTKTELRNDIKVLLAGREAESILLGDTSIGCSNDIERATVLAFNIINNFAMSDDNLVNIVALSNIGVNIFDTTRIISDMNGILRECREEVKEMLASNKHSLEILKDRLLAEETVIEPDLNVLEV